jgi:hypothetical protein
MSSFVVRDVQADGNCFYRALYQSARRAGKLKRILRRFGVTKAAVTTEDDFIQVARHAVAQQVKTSSVILDIYNNFSTIRKESKKTYKMITRSYPSWFVAKFARLPKTSDLFRERLAKYMQTNGNWVSEIDIRMVLEILHGIPIRILNSLPKPSTKLDSKTIYLLNISECHYKYLRIKG